MWLYVSDLFHAKIVWMPSVCYIPNYYLQNCGSKTIRSKFLLNRGLFLIFFISLYQATKAAFFAVLSLVFAKGSFASVKHRVDIN